MTTVLDPAARSHALARRLDLLREHRAQVASEVAPTMRGDDADRATNVDAHVRLAMLDDRIAAVELAQAQPGNRPATDAAHDAVRVGDVVTVNFGDGPEDYLLDSVEQSSDGLDVITPGSPLGRALIGATLGSTVGYRAAGRELRVNVLATTQG